MTTSAPALQWWPTTWGALRPGDDILAPDGSTWTVGPAIISDGAGEWRIMRDGLDVWTPHREDEPVQARRPKLAGDVTDGSVILAKLRAALGDVEEVSHVEAPRPGAGRWLLCGRRECKCNEWRR